MKLLVLLLATALSGCRAGTLHLRGPISWGIFSDTGDNDAALLRGGEGSDVSTRRKLSTVDRQPDGTGRAGTLHLRGPISWGIFSDTGDNDAALLRGGEGPDVSTRRKLSTVDRQPDGTGRAGTLHLRGPISWGIFSDTGDNDAALLRGGEGSDVSTRRKLSTVDRQPDGTGRAGTLHLRGPISWGIFSDTGDNDAALLRGEGPDVSTRRKLSTVDRQPDGTGRAGTLHLRGPISWGIFSDTGDNDAALLRGGEGPDVSTRRKLSTVDRQPDGTGNYWDKNPSIMDSRDWKIVGGTVLSPNERPYLVMVQAVAYGKKYAVCGGTIIDERHVLSAAHCFRGPASQYGITAGQHHKTVTEASEQFRSVQKIISHPSYDAIRLLNDIAVLKLASPLDLSGPAVSPIDLNDNVTCPEIQSTCSVAGWGRVQEGGLTSDVPLKVDLPVLPQSTCSAVYGGKYGDDQICTGGEEGKGGCQGDSGGPLVCECGGVVYQTGVVSYGDTCGGKDKPTVFARVSSYMSWIRPILTASDAC
ncbi:uncharacterized protein LOC143286546 [Babylonia areolata]|uniref:uncharacterized protein LOC143286546 n=1 Tax=Babylonia areolata TaxID=304850 RepID=UPI003FCF0E4F